MLELRSQGLQSITASDLEKYFIANNWQRDFEFPNKNIMLFKHCKKDARLAIAASEKYKDFHISLPNIIKSISIIESKEIDLIISDLLNISFVNL